MAPGLNILFVTLDQFRGDCLSCAGHPVVETPNLDRLAREGVRFARHYAQAAPCGPGRASLYTGLYQMNHRVVANGTPLDARFDNVAHAARRAGYDPTLFGYTDQSVDPRETAGPGDERLQTYEGVLPGFSVGCHLPAEAPTAWTDWLKARGEQIFERAYDNLTHEMGRPAELSQAAFLTDRFLDWMGRQDRPWFAHLSQLRPHPPYTAAGRFGNLYDHAVPPAPIVPSETRHKLHERLLSLKAMGAPNHPGAMAFLQTQYFGMIAEADFQLGRIWAALEASGQWARTLIVVTADHGEQLGDHGLIQKGGFFEQSYHIPAIVRDPRAAQGHGRVVERFTEAVDIFPTLCDAMGLPIPAQCDGAPLTPFLFDQEPPWWREAAHWEFDWRGVYIERGPHPWPWDRRLEAMNLAVVRSEDAAYVHFADGSFLAFDLAADPTWRTPIEDPARVLEQAQALLTWRAQHADRTLTGMLVEKGGLGRWPPMPDGWGGAG